MKKYVLLSLLIGLFLVSDAFPHSLDPESIDRHAELIFTPSKLVLIYQAVLGINPTERASQQLDTDDNGDITDSERDQFLQQVAQDYLSQQIITLGDHSLSLAMVQGDVYSTIGHNGMHALKIDFGCVAPLPAGIPRDTTLPFFYEDQKIAGVSGWLQMNASGKNGVQIGGHIPYQQYKPFDYDLINEKGFFPTTRKIQIEVNLPQPSETNDDIQITLPEKYDLDEVNKSNESWESWIIGGVAILMMAFVVSIVVRMRH